MKIEKQVETVVDVEVHLSVEDIAAAIVEEPDSLSHVLRGINNAHTFLKAIPDSMIGFMTDKQRQTIYDAMLIQVQRYAQQHSDEVGK